MFRRVLLPTDLSTRPVALAVDPASLKELGVEDLVLLNVIEVGPQIGFASDTFERVAAWEDTERALNEQKARIEACGVRCRTFAAWSRKADTPRFPILVVRHRPR